MHGTHPGSLVSARAGLAIVDQVDAARHPNSHGDGGHPEQDGQHSQRPTHVDGQTPHSLRKREPCRQAAEPWPTGATRSRGACNHCRRLVAIVAIGALLRWGAVRSRGAPRRFNLAIAVFSLWNGVVIAVSVASGWWAAGQPGIHATVSFAVSALPLAAAACLVRPRSR